MAGDWIKLHRQSLDSQVFSDPALWRLFCWCLLKTNWKTGFFNGVEVKPGSFATGRESAADSLGMSGTAWYRGIKKLESMGLISVKANNRFTVISVAKWSFFQNSEQQTDNRRTTDEQQTDTIEEGNKSRRGEGEKGEESQEGKEGNNQTAHAGGKSKRSVEMDHVTAAAFDRFWAAYPSKASKQPARRAFAEAFKRLAKSTNPVHAADKLECAAIDYATFLDEHPNPPKTKYAQGWLNDERYEDDYVEELARAKRSAPAQKTFSQLKQERTQSAFEEVFGNGQDASGELGIAGFIRDVRDGGDQ